MNLKPKTIVQIDRGLAPSLLGVKAKILRISPISTLTVELLEDGHGSSCWKKGDIVHLKPYNIKEIDSPNSGDYKGVNHETTKHQ